MSVVYVLSLAGPGSEVGEGAREGVVSPDLGAGGLGDRDHSGGWGLCSEERQAGLGAGGVVFVVTSPISNGQCEGPPPNQIATGLAREPLIPSRPWPWALVSAHQCAAPAPCLPKWPPSQGQSRLPTCWAQCCLSRSSMLGTVILLLALLPGTTTVPSEPAGMYRQGDMAQHTSIPVLPFLSAPSHPPPWGNGGGWEVGSAPSPVFQVLWDPQLLQSPGSHGETKGCGRGAVCANAFRDCLCR